MINRRTRLGREQSAKAVAISGRVRGQKKPENEDQCQVAKDTEGGGERRGGPACNRLTGGHQPFWFYLLQQRPAPRLTLQPFPEGIEGARHLLLQLIDLVGHNRRSKPPHENEASGNHQHEERQSCEAGQAGPA